VLDDHAESLKQFFGLRIVLLVLALTIMGLMETKPF
jgi:hypothetical protein